MAEQDRQDNTQAHADQEFLAREMASLRMLLGEVATRDYVRSELRSLLADLEDRVVLRDEHAEADGLGTPRPSGETDATPGEASSRG